MFKYFHKSLAKSWSGCPVDLTLCVHAMMGQSGLWMSSGQGTANPVCVWSAAGVVPVFVGIVAVVVVAVVAGVRSM